MELFRSVPSGTGHFAVFAPGDAGLEQLGLEVVRLAAGETYAANSGQREIAAVILSGVCDVRVQENGWKALGGRKDVFSGKATAVYIPPGADFELVGAGTEGVEIALCSAPGGEGGPFSPYVVTPDQVVVNDRGSGAFRRQVHDIIDKGRPAHHLVVGETFNQPGLWSSYPPHKHDVDNPPVEYKMEEIYLFKVDPPQGFGVQALYSKDPARPLDEAYIIRENTAVALPFGYHPVAAAPGYRVYYLWFLSGSTRELVPNDDPDHAWVKSL